MRIIFSIILMLVVFGTIKFQSKEIESRSQVVPRVAFPHKVRVSFYPVEGATVDELHSSMLERGPIGHGNKRFFAYTLWRIKLLSSRDRHSSRGKFQCYISMLLPFLRPDKDRNKDITLKWKSFLESIVAHESRHVRNVIYACRVLNRTNINETKLRVVSRRLKSRDEEYDNRTRHGLLEGVSIR